MIETNETKSVVLALCTHKERAHIIKLSTTLVRSRWIGQQNNKLNKQTITLTLKTIG